MDRTVENLIIIKTNMQAKKPASGISVRYVKGVGPARTEVFERLGIRTVSDLFYYLPRRYEDRSVILEIKDIKPGEDVAVKGRVERTRIFRIRTGKTIFELVLSDGTNKLYAVWYNQPYMKKVFAPDQEVMLYGRIELQNRLQMSHPTYEILSDKNGKDSINIGRIVPVYSLTRTLTQGYLRKVVDNAIHVYINGMEDMLPTHIRAKEKLVDTVFAVRNIHFPVSQENLEKAYKRLVFEEFFILQVVMALKRKKIRSKGIQYNAGKELFSEFQELFDFELTSGQKACIKAIQADMTGDKPMYRLLQGDVGSGKTIVAMYAMLLAFKNGYQSAVMVPTEILARQHFVTISKAFMPLGINVRLLVGGIGRDDKEAVKKEIEGKEADIVIGTHALLQENVSFCNLGLVIVDEQHKFGVKQREKLRSKGPMPDMLVMTATPIPRSLVMTVYGDMDISLLKDKPPGREQVTTYWLEEDRREFVYGFIRDEISAGRQAFIVYPRIKESPTSDTASAERMFEHLEKDVFPDLKLALIHGKMSPGEKEKIMEKFVSGEYDILVATTVVEVGVDIPNVTVMFVENAEHYGLSQLHQLRGRIGRGKFSSYCILMSDARTNSSYERLSTMTETDDGFKIAEKDLDIRGPGEFLGTRQSGLPELKLGNIVRDCSIMETARSEAFALIREDPRLEDARNAGIRKLIIGKFRGKVDI